MYHTWHWGPGQHSIRRLTVGAGADGQPWRELQVYYWHPGREQICVLGMSPFARGIGEGTMQFNGETADGVFDLYQSGGTHRRMGLRWVFDGQDKYHDILLEASGSDELQPLVEFDQVRSRPAAVPRPRTVEGASPSDYLRAIEPLLGHIWEADGAWFTGEALHTRTTFEWVPIADAIHVRVVAPTADGEPGHLLDAYIYHHTGTQKLRCLALSSSGGVHEGDLTILESGPLQLDLQGHSGQRVGQFAFRFDFEADGTLRNRGWSLNGTDRTLLLDIHHRKREPQKN
jgi:hypothetical protein